MPFTKKPGLSNRFSHGVLAAAAVLGLAAAGTTPASLAATKVIKVGITLPLTGADAEAATRMKDGALLAIREADAKGGIDGYTIHAVVLNDATATAGQYDPAQAATNARKLISDPGVVANVGPEMSGSGKAMSPVFSEGDLATVTPTSTNPDITAPRFAPEYRPKGKAIYFRTVTTDNYQGPNMANFYAEKLHVKSVYVLDDSGAYGVGLANTFQKQAAKDGIKVLGRDRLDPREADYTTILTKIKGLHPDAIYYGGVEQAGDKLIKQAYDIIPNVIKGGGDGLYGEDTLSGAGFPAVQGWYCTIASPHIVDNPDVQPWVDRFHKTYGVSPDDYAITSYDAALVVLHAIKQVAESGKPITRANVRDAIQSSHVKTLQGEIAYDKNGDMLNKVISVFEIDHNAKYPDTDMMHQYKYVGVAPQS